MYKIIGGIVGLIALAISGYYFLNQSSVMVTASEPGALVRIDGKLVAKTPMEPVSVAAGTHLLEVTHTHFAPYSEQIQVAAGESVSRDVQLALGEGELSLLSNPRGAWIEIDGELLDAVTPTRLTLRSGPHTITMGQAERRPTIKEVVLMHGQTLPVNLELSMDPHGTLVLKTRPNRTNIAFVGSDLTYSSGMRLPMGDYNVRVSATGYESRVVPVTVRYGDNEQAITLRRAYGQLAVNVKPASARVIVSYGRGSQAVRKVYTEPLRVPVGKVNVQVRAMGRRSASRQIDLSSRGSTLNFNLQVMTAKAGEIFADSFPEGGAAPSLVVVPAGTLRMVDAQATNPSERNVEFTQPFAIGRYEVTVAEYARFAAATGRGMPRKLENPEDVEPVRFVRPADALAYVQWLSSQTGKIYRLPTEAEWEYVARAGTKSTHFFGDDPTEICVYGNVADQTTKKVYRQWDVVACDDGHLRPAAVGSYAANGFGVFDIYGNVSEWVADCGDGSYALAPSDGTIAAKYVACDRRGYRGGSWDSGVAESSSLSRNSSSGASDDRGFRVLRML